MTSTASFNWILSDPVWFLFNRDKVKKDELRAFLEHEFKVLAEEFCRSFSDVTSSENALLEVISTGFKLTTGLGYSENQIHSASCRGGGEITASAGHLPLLFFASLRKVIESKLPDDLSDALMFCKNTGELFPLSNLLELEAECNRLGIFTDDLRADAEAVGFVERLYHLDRIATTEPSMFF